MWLAAVALVVGGALAILFVRLGNARHRDRVAVAKWKTISKVSALLAEILHADTTLEDVLRLLVPTFADWSAVLLLEDGDVRRAVVVHADPELERELRNRQFPFVRDAPFGPAKVLRTGEPDLQHGRAETLAGQLDPDLLERAGIGSRISVPLRARQQLIGAMAIHSHRQRPDSAQDLMRFPRTQHAAHKFHHSD